MKKNKQAIIEALKEAGRLALLAGVSYLVSILLKMSADLPETQTTIILTFLLKGLDKWLAKRDQSIIPAENARGLTGF